MNFCDDSLLISKFMLPHAKNSPSLSIQYSLYKPVTSFVCSKFLFPKRPIIGRHSGMFRAAMPKTAIHKHRKPCFWEDEIGFAENRLMSAPAFDAMPPEQFRQRQFRFLVPASTNPRHHCRPFCFGENVSHWSYSNSLKKPKAGLAGVPINNARSRSLLPSSHEVSGNRQQP